MNIFSGNLVVGKNAILWNLKCDYIANLSTTWERVIFVFWETETLSSAELLELFREQLWEITKYDLSHSVEDKIDIFHTTYEEWAYELASFEWENMNLADIKDRFEDFEEAVCVREAEKSEKFWNRVIKVDFVY